MTITHNNFDACKDHQAVIMAMVKISENKRAIVNSNGKLPELIDSFKNLDLEINNLNSYLPDTKFKFEDFLDLDELPYFEGSDKISKLRNKFTVWLYDEFVNPDKYYSPDATPRCIMSDDQH